MIHFLSDSKPKTYEHGSANAFFLCYLSETQKLWITDAPFLRYTLLKFIFPVFSECIQKNLKYKVSRKHRESL